MAPLGDVVQQGGLASLLFIPSAVLLGALHGLEPGHSKTMMAAFIIAVRGTVAQAILLGIAATLSHTAIVWVVALGGLYLFNGVDAEAAEPYFQVASAVLIIVIAVWMLQRTWREQRLMRQVEAAARVSQTSNPDMRQVNTGHGIIGLTLVTANGPARWQLRTLNGCRWSGDEVSIATMRPDGSRRVFKLAARDGVLESLDVVPEPYVFTATITLTHDDHDHDFDVEFNEGGLTQSEVAGLDLSTGEHQDAHSLAHANEIKRRFANRSVTTGQIVMFGLSGGLIPCPAAITVLLLCLQVKKLLLGAAIVTAFSIGLALTMVVAGVAAAVSVQQIARRWSGFGHIAQRAPYFSGGVIIAMGLYLGYSGLHVLAAAGAI
jgi:nickel/cobalt exporter